MANPVTTIDDYIAGCAGPARAILQRIRALVRRLAPEAEETIKYQIPTFTLGQNLVHFAAFQHHIGFYPTPSGIAAFASELAPYPSAKGSVQFPLDRAIPYDLIEKIVRFRVAEVQSRGKTKPGKTPPKKKSATAGRKKAARRSGKGKSRDTN